MTTPGNACHDPASHHCALIHSHQAQPRPTKSASSNIPPTATSRRARACIEPLEPRTLLTAAPGQLDSTFAQGGTVRLGTTVPAAVSIPLMIAAPNGKLLVLSDVQGAGLTTRRLTRLTAAGIPDPSFARTGSVNGPLIRLSVYDDDFVAVQLDGKILVGGAPANNPAQTDEPVLLLRFNQNGTIDTSFGHLGFAQVRFTSPNPQNRVDDLISGLAVLGNGQIMVQGTLDGRDGARRFGFARLNADGSLDSSFGERGRVVSHLGRGLHVPDRIHPQSDGSALVVGFGARSVSIVITRYTPDGAYDTTFGDGGKIRLPGQYAGSLINLTRAPSGDIVVTSPATRTSTGQTLAYVSRYHANGTPDLAFGRSGLVTLHLHIPLQVGDAPTPQLAFHNNQTILSMPSQDNNEMSLLRLLPKGAVDSTFGVNGLVNLTNQQYHLINQVTQFTQDARGDTYVPNTFPAGTDTGNAGMEQFNVARFTPDGRLDLSYASAGRSPGNAQLNFNAAANDEFVDAAQGADGSIVISGVSEGHAQNPTYLSRLSADGSKDASFGTAGHLNVSGFGTLAIPSDGTIFFAPLGDPMDTVVTRYTTAGAIDRTFADQGVISFARPSSPQPFLKAFAAAPDGASFALLWAPQTNVLAPYKIAAISSAGQLLNEIPPSAFVTQIATAPGDMVLTVGMNGGDVWTALTLQIKRYQQNLTADNTFGHNALAEFPVPLDFSFNSLSIALDSSIIVYGTTGSSNTPMFMKITAAGTLDSSFGQNGIAKPTLPFGKGVTTRSIAVQADGKVVIGASQDSVHPSFQITRLTAAGELDTVFANHGLLTDNFGGQDATLAKISVTPNNKLLAFGTIAPPGTYQTSQDIIVARYDL